MLWIREIFCTDPAPALFVRDVKDVKKNSFFQVFCLLQVIKKAQNSRNKGFSYYFCLMEGFGSVQIMTDSERPQNFYNSQASLVRTGTQSRTYDLRMREVVKFLSNQFSSRVRCKWV